MIQTGNWLRDPSHYPIPSAAIGKRFYVYRDEKNNLTYAKHINFELIKHMVNREGIFF